MKKIDDLFTDFFDSHLITNNRLAGYTQDHLARIAANNPGSVFSGIKTATEAALSTFGNALNAIGGDIGDRKASTQTKEGAREAFNVFIRQKEGLIKSTFGKPSTQYTQFFPNGLTPFSEATDLEYELLVANIVARATQYETELGTPFKEAAQGFASAYLEAEGAQTTEKGDVAAGRDALVTATAALTRQLTINALTIALHFPLDETKPVVYFDTSLLFAQHRKHIIKGKPAANATELAAKLTYEAGTTIAMANKGATILAFRVWLIGNPVGATFTLNPGEKLSKRMDDFFTNADALYVTNQGGTAGIYEVELIA